MATPAGAAVADTKIATIAGTGTAGASGDGGPATAATLQTPFGVAVDTAGNMFIADTLNHRVRRVDPAGVITTIAGTGVFGFSGDGGPATAAKLFSPKGVATDADGNVYIADWGNNRIRRVDIATKKIATVAGTGVPGFSGDGGRATAAGLKAPTGVAVGLGGGLLVADTANNRIRLVDTSGAIVTVAGGGPGALGDGGLATAASLVAPTAVLPEPAGGFYIADAGNARVRRVNTVGLIATVAGGGTSTADGEAATSTNLTLGTNGLTPGLALDPNGDVYVSESGQHKVRRVTPDGLIYTLAGTGDGGFSGDGGSAVGANLQQPAGLAVVSSGRLLIADSMNNRIRAVQAPPLAINDISVAEGNSGTRTAALTITTRSNSHAFDLSYSTADGTATVADHDYVPTSGTLHFSAGQWRATISVQVVGDSGPEADEAFSVHVSGSPYPDVSGGVTLRNDDGPLPVISVEDSSVTEGDSGETTTALVTVRKSGSTTRPVTVEYATLDGTSTAPRDYLSASGTVTFLPGDYDQGIAVTVFGNEEREPARTFRVQLSNPRDAVIANDFAPPPGKPFDPPVHHVYDTATVSVVDNDGPRWKQASSLDSCAPTNASCAPRQFHTATTLNGPSCSGVMPPAWCGNVLVVGGEGAAGTAELYDPITQAWRPTGRLELGHKKHTATLLADGRVLVVGGVGEDQQGIAESELYDPATGRWTVTDPPDVGRFYHSATLLDDGTVLLIGGTETSYINPPTDSVELFDPLTGSWRHCTAGTAHRGCPAPMPEPREENLAVKLTDGRVLVAGGLGAPRASGELPPLSSAILYDPATGRWTSAGRMVNERAVPQAAVIDTAPCGQRCGKVLVVGGGTSPSAEIYDPSANSWTGAPVPDVDQARGPVLPDSLARDSLFKLPDGTVSLVSPQAGETDVYDPLRDEWSLGSSNAPLSAATAGSVLDSATCRRPEPAHYCGAILVVGGGRTTAVPTAALYTPAPVVRSLTPTSAPSAGGATVIVKGGNFSAATRVRFGDVPAAAFHIDSSSQITATAPRQPSGRVEVSVRTPMGGTSQHFPTDLSVPFSYDISRPPLAVSDLAATPASDASVELSWSAPASDDTFPPPAGGYVIKASTTEIASDDAFAAAPALCSGPCEFQPPAVGARLTMAVSGLSPGTTYHFALRAVNSAGQVGPRSNPAGATTTGQPPVAGATTPPAAPTPASGPTGAAGAADTGITGDGSFIDQAPTAGKSPTSPAISAPTPTAPPTRSPEPTTTTVPPGRESVFGQAAAPQRTSHRVPTWLWVILGISLFANVAVVGAYLNRRFYRVRRS